MISKCRKQGTIDLADLYEPPADCQPAVLTERLENNWFNEIKRNPNNPSLIRATISTVRWEPLLIGLILIPIVSSLEKIDCCPFYNEKKTIGNL